MAVNELHRQSDATCFSCIAVKSDGSSITGQRTLHGDDDMYSGVHEYWSVKWLGLTAAAAVEDGLRETRLGFSCRRCSPVEQCVLLNDVCVVIVEFCISFTHELSFPFFFSAQRTAIKCISEVWS